MKIRKAEFGNPFNKPDVAIEIWSTPEITRIRKIESLYKHRMQPQGVDEQLLLKVFLAPGSRDEFREMGQYDRDPGSLASFWNVHANNSDSSLLKPPPDVITHATCLHFFPRKPRARAMFVPKPDYCDDPRSVLAKDSDLRPKEDLKFAGIIGPELSWVSMKRVMRGNTKMY